jgi:23S rRNA (cytidine1920-2'-O)/16S rRNA (cytidine1409-2'-O)-methyltransferase
LSTDPIRVNQSTIKNQEIKNQSSIKDRQINNALMPRVRLDQLVVERGLAPSRERARAMILAGQVTVDDRPATKAGTTVDDQAAVALLAPDHPYAGRGGLKLAHALDTFQIDVRGRDCLDIGASTGGFTDVLLQRGAARVVALDVGHGQLDWRLRNDERVVVMERFNARYLTLQDLPGPVDLVAIDVSFISLRLILPPVTSVLRASADVAALVKPQFEAGRSEVRKGVIRDPAVHARVLEEVAAAAREVGLSRVASTPSPITGQKGNIEFLVHFRPS